jgi:cytochrome P450
MEVTLSPRKLLWRATPWFKLLVRRKRYELFQYLQPFIAASMQTIGEGPRTVSRSAVHEIARELTDKEMNTVAQTPNDPSMEHLFYQLMIFFFGGDDAISITVPRIFRQLHLNPECVTKIRAEHDTILGADASVAAERIREEPHTLDSLQYTLGVTKETLRMNPATITIREGQPSFNFQIKGDDGPWPTDGFDLFDSSIIIHHDPNNFADPYKFIPERYSVSEAHTLDPEKDAWRGFQLGPRRCIGQELVVVVLKLVLGSTIRTFDIEMAWDKWDAIRELQGVKFDRRTVEGERMYTTGKATSHPKDGAPMHVRIQGTSSK